MVEVTGALIALKCESEDYGKNPTNTGAPIEVLDLSQCHGIDNIHCGGMLAKELNLSRLPYIKYIYSINCPNLERVIAPRHSLATYSEISFMFGGCPKLASLDLSTVPNTSLIYANLCTSLRSLNISTCTNLKNLWLNGSTALATIDTATSFVSGGRYTPQTYLANAIKASTATGTKTLTLYGNGPYKSALKTAGTSAGWTVKEVN